MSPRVPSAATPVPLRRIVQVERFFSDLECAGGVPPMPDIRQRPLIMPELAAELMSVFNVLDDGSRLRLRHALLRAAQLSVGEPAAVAMKPQAESNQRQCLTDRGIVDCRGEGNSIIYRIVDPCVIGLLDQGLCLTDEDAGARQFVTIR